MELQEPNRQLWLWLLYDGGAWSATDLAAHLRRDWRSVFSQLDGMARRDLIEKMPPLPGQRAHRFAVTGTCKVPYGVRIAEVQCDLVAPVSALQISRQAGPRTRAANREFHRPAPHERTA